MAINSGDPAHMPNKALLDALNADLADELQATIQYMWHHVMAHGMHSPEVLKIFHDISIDEMKHAEKLAERLDYFGVTPTTKPSAITTGGDLEKMMRDDLAGEEQAIQGYAAHIKLAADLGDHVTRLMLEQILSDEQEHAHTWRTILEK